MEPTRLGPQDAGEMLTLQRAAFVTEAQAHRSPTIAPLTESLDELRDAVGDPACLSWGFRDGNGRLVACVRVVVLGDVAEIGRLVVAPDQQRKGLGSALVRTAEVRLPRGVRLLRLFTGEHSAGPLKLYAGLGYRETRRTPLNGYHLVHFEKELPTGPQPPSTARHHA